MVNNCKIQDVINNFEYTDIPRKRKMYRTKSRD